MTLRTDSLGVAADLMAQRVKAGKASFRDLAQLAGLDPAADFVGADLAHVDLSGEDLTGFDFRRADLSYADLSGANLTGCTFAGAILTGTIGLDALPDVPMDPPHQPTAPSILVLYVGKRAEEISRSVEPPDWSPELNGSDPGWRLAVTKDAGARRELAPVGQIHIAPIGAQVPDGDFDVIIVFADNEREVDSSRHWLDLHFKSKMKLLAPALPKDRPTELLIDRQVRGFHAIIDTSIARSPFWSGNASRALDRRIADTAVGVAAVIASSEAIALRLDGMAHPRTPLVSLAFVSDDRTSSVDHDHTLALSSESAGLVRIDEPGGDVFPFWPRWIRQRLKNASRGLFLITRELADDIPGFLRAAAEHASPTHRGFSMDTGDVPAEIRHELEFKGLAAGLRLFSGEAPPVAVVAETPRMKLIQRAARVGWRVARYTDGAYLAEALSAERPSTPRQLPGELQLPKVRRQPENKGLVTRGADSRDIIVFRQPLYDRLRAGAPDLSASARRFRLSFQRGREPEYMLPTYEISRWLDVAGENVVREELEKLRAEKPRIPKRPADLRVACAEPAPGVRRFAVADGLLPIRIDHQPSDEVPAQSMFIVDGDAAVPLLLQSSVFAVWARATATRSTSWMASRFSVTRTFETFPIIGAFRIDRYGAPTAQLRLSGESELSDLAAHWLDVIDYTRDPAKLPDDLTGLRQRLDEEVLANYRLPMDADDLRIMERLLELNQP